MMTGVRTITKKGLMACHTSGATADESTKSRAKNESDIPFWWNENQKKITTPVIMAIFAALARRGKEISTPRKIAIGMFIAGLAFLFLAIYSLIAGYPSADAYKALPIAEQMAGKAHWWVLIAVYFFLTVAELFISPLGLSFVSKVAPKHLLGLCQGLWLGATALGNLMLWVGPLMYNAWPIWQCWTVFLVVCLISMGVMLGMVKWLERVTK